jgi:MFS family permease
VFADRIGLDLQQLSNFMASAIIAAMLLAWPIGRVCDRFDRYRVMLVVAVVAGLSSLVAAFISTFSNYSPLALLLFVGLYMGLSAAIYPIAVAITNDLMESHQVTAASTALLLSYGVGSIIGPLLSALFMELLGAKGLFISNALVLGGLSLFMLVGPGRDHPEVTQQEHYYTTSPEAGLGLSELDPRYTEFEEHPAADSNREER